VRRLRGVLGTALVWAAAFGAFGACTGVLSVVLFALMGRMGAPRVTADVLAQAALAVARWAALGTLSGVTFATLLLLTSRGRAPSAWSSRRLTLLGTAAGAGGSAAAGAALVAAMHLSLRVASPLIASPLFWSALFALFGGLLGTGMARATLRAVRGGAGVGVLTSGNTDTRLTTTD
jgi:cytochrome bd-type quinol oxidase subunit 2